MSPFEFDKVLVAIDGSEGADRALDCALSLVSRLGGRLTLGWNVVGTGVLLATTVPADSIALVSFGLDSMIEVVASLVVIWQLKGVPGPPVPGRTPARLRRSRPTAEAISSEQMRRELGHD